MAFHRTPRLPDDVRGRLTLGPGEKVVAAAPLVGGWAAATTHALHVAPDDAEAVARPWYEVDAARLDPETHVLSVVWVDGATVDLELADHRDIRFPREVHGRVRTSVVHSERVEVGIDVVRVVLRRDADGALFTQVLAPPTADLGVPGAADAVAAAEARVREAAGLA